MIGEATKSIRCDKIESYKILNKTKEWRKTFSQDAIYLKSFTHLPDGLFFLLHLLINGISVYSLLELGILETLLAYSSVFYIPPCFINNQVLKVPSEMPYKCALSSSFFISLTISDTV